MSSFSVLSSTYSAARPDGREAPAPPQRVPVTTSSRHLERQRQRPSCVLALISSPRGGNPTSLRAGVTAARSAFLDGEAEVRTLGPQLDHRDRPLLASGCGGADRWPSSPACHGSRRCELGAAEWASLQLVVPCCTSGRGELANAPATIPGWKRRRQVPGGNRGRGFDSRRPDSHLRQACRFGVPGC
jgi:hypothetical protein